MRGVHEFLREGVEIRGDTDNCCLVDVLVKDFGMFPGEAFRMQSVTLKLSNGKTIYLNPEDFLCLHPEAQDILNNAIEEAESQ